MPYCPNCGSQYHPPQNFCENCGRPIGSSASALGSKSEHPSYNPSVGSGRQDNYLVSSIETALERTDTRRRRRRNAVAGANESLELYAGGVGVIAFIHGLSLLGGNWSGLLAGPLGLLMVFSIVAGTLFKIVFDMRLGYSLRASLLHTLVAGVLIYGGVFGTFWYFTHAFTFNANSLLPLSPPTPTPHG